MGGFEFHCTFWNCVALGKQLSELEFLHGQGKMVCCAELDMDFYQKPLAKHEVEHAYIPEVHSMAGSICGTGRVHDG